MRSASSRAALRRDLRRVAAHAARVDLALHDGRQLTARRDLRRGDPEDPFDSPALLQRLRDFAPALDDRRAALIERSCRSVTDPALDAQPAPLPATVFGAAE